MDGVMTDLNTKGFDGSFDAWVAGADNYSTRGWLMGGVGKPPPSIQPPKPL